MGARQYWALLRYAAERRGSGVDGFKHVFDWNVAGLFCSRVRARVQRLCEVQTCVARAHRVLRRRRNRALRRRLVVNAVA